jgi:NAD(P)-dependent dehydrogenase (short-subunit alcohol dehydrogenase family)
MSQPAQISALFSDVSERYERLDVLVNSAGVTRVIDLLDVTPDDWDTIININAHGTLLAMQGAARMMAGVGGGRIVNIGSISAKGFKESSNIVYASSKAAVVNVTRIAATRFGPLNIRVNCVCPGMTKTKMWSSWIDDRSAATGRSRADLLEEMSAKVPLHRLNEPTDVAAAVLFFATDVSRPITSQSLNVDGGTMWD